jgi:serine/threonine-protein kinase HipA
VEPPAPQRRFHRTLDLERIKQAADAILSEEPQRAGSALEQVEELIGQAGTSMGGARPKTTVEADQALWLAKFPAPSDAWNQPRVEHGLLLLARRCGLQVADSRLTRVGDADVLLVKRFDHDWSEGGYRRHRMVSALTLLQAEDSATDRGKWSYLLLADELRRVSAQPAADLRELFGRICFNAAVSNIDDHPRLRPHAGTGASRDPPRPGHGLRPGGAQPQPLGQPPGDPGRGGTLSPSAGGSRSDPHADLHRRGLQLGGNPARSLGEPRQPPAPQPRLP